MRRPRLTVASVLTLAATACGGARTAPDTGPAPSGSPSAVTGSMVYPAGYDRSERYPVVIMLPASNGTSIAMYRSYPSSGDVILLLASGTGRAADYATNSQWAATIATYEQRLLDDLTALEARGVRIGPVILAGFSMGGDLAWALTLRNPSRIAGAIVMGSRASYRAGPAEMRTLRDGGTRFFFAMGEHEDGTRVAGARAAIRLLENERIVSRYEEVPNAAHERFSSDVWLRAVRFVLEGRGR